MDLAGTDCPAFLLEAAVSARPVGPDALRGRRTVLIFHGPRTTDAPKEIGKAVRAAHPLAADVFVANIVDLKSMGGLWTKVATAQLKSTYEKLAAKLTKVDPAEYVVMCPDWKGTVAPLFGVADPNQAAGVAVLDAQGKVVGATDTGDLAAQTLSWLG